MAMDKEMLIAYFQEHYLSRQEVLFKLPLNYSISSFWPELLDRRKSRAAVLPLYNGTGMPYWYVLTQKMVSASERLCCEAISQDGAFDPYRAEMTSAMTEEMFFTSFVEGAQFPLQEAMDFLSRGTEPESIHEQMIWNNRHAWSEMVAGIYRPLDEPFVKALAFMLTEEMDGCAEDYRQVDSHPIAAMDNEPYEILPARMIPERMSQYYDFLRLPDTHPLIKAAAAQAYLLVSRPFPEGNERLSRMMSSAVLLRCGYDFFRDISISSVIARENYRYYKAMRDIIRPENGGDMTYFMEYYLELLVRALDDRKERLLRRQQETLESERRMAAMPLARTEASREPPDAGEDSQDGSQDDDDGMDLVVGEHMPMDIFLSSVEKLKHSPNSRARETRLAVQNMLAAGRYTFTVQQWAESTGQTRNSADYQCRYLFQKGFLDKDKRGAVMTYTFRIIRTEEGSRDNQPSDPEEPSQPRKTDESPPQNGPLLSWIAACDRSREAYKRSAAEFLRHMIAEGRVCFTTKDLIEQAGMTNMQAKHVRDQMVYHRLVVNTSPGVKPSVMRLLTGGCSEPALLICGNSNASKRVAVKHAASISKDAARDALASLLKSKSEAMRKAAETVKLLAGQGRLTFLRRDWPSLTGLPQAKACDTCDLMLKRGIIINDRPGEHTALYRINTMPPENDASPSRQEDAVPGIKTCEPSGIDSRISLFLSQKAAKGQMRFSADEWRDHFGIGQSSYNNDIRRAVAQGLVTRIGMTAERFAIYEINKSPESGLKGTGMTRRQRELLGVLYEAFGSNRFTVRECAEIVEQAETGIAYYLKLFVDRGIMSFERRNSKPGNYMITVTPETHPGCFSRGLARQTAAPWSGSAPLAAASASRQQAVV